ncbi:hypothetical protein IHQ68_16565 [Chelatococcus sambhunathii]|uniref:Sulfotransferase family n=1 Tax=Chelatococcus sambhunathii TaxID=363953 RepID=A0ABU1DJN4_9HYPH|nr:hypothetical protein [Chelatococcus sambhunathii]MDR4308233.1 hypothetical protein [Chelatococcus sambhunathii]
MKLFLHVGTHKTGSTHLQIYLRNHAAELARQGLVYPDPADWFGGKPQVAQHLLTAAAAQKKNRFDACRRRVDQARLDARPGDTMLISSEPAWRRTFPEICPPDELWEGRRRYVRRLRRVFARFDATVVVCLRNRATFGESHYGSAVKSGYAKGFEDYLEDHAFMFDYNRQTALFREAFGDVLTYTYEEAAREGVSETLLRKIGFVAPAPDDRPPTRRSPDRRLFLWLARRNALAGEELSATRSERTAFSITGAAAAALPDAEPTTFWSERTRPFLERFDDGAAMDGLAGRRLASLSEAEHAALDAAFEDWRSSDEARRRRARVAA